MAKDKGYHEKGIRDGVDYGTQFLNARAGGGDEPPPPPPPPVADDEVSGGRGFGMVLMVVLLVAAVGAGIAGFVLFGGDDGGGRSGDLVTAGEVRIDERGRPVLPTTTTEAPATTTTAAPTTTVAPTTVAPTTTTTLPFPDFGQPGQPTDPGLPGQPGQPDVPVTPPPTVTPSCPGGRSQTSYGPPTFFLVGEGLRRGDMEGTTTNETTAAFDFTLVLVVQYQPVAGQVQTKEFRTHQDGQSIPPGGSINWSATLEVASVTTPQVLQAAGNWRWSDPALASCPTGSFTGG